MDLGGGERAALGGGEAGYLEAARAAEGFASSERTRVAGVAFYEKMIELMEPFVQSRAD